MKISFATEALRNECNNQELLVSRYGQQRARILRQRLDELFNADVLEDMRRMPHVTFLGSGQGPADLALDLGRPYRLAFRPHPEPTLNGGWDWKKIDSIQIVGLIRTDDKKGR